MKVGSVDGTHGFARGVWNMLNDGGVWGIPRSGLVYRKRERTNELALVERMPWSEGMPFPAEELREFQDSDHEGCVAIFRVIGIDVVDST